MLKKKYQCENCGFYWEKNPADTFPKNCPVCLNSRIHQSTGHKRFAKKSRPRVKRQISNISARK